MEAIGSRFEWVLAIFLVIISGVGSHAISHPVSGKSHIFPATSLVREEEGENNEGFWRISQLSARRGGS